MDSHFNLWSDNNPDAHQNICPDLGIREWNKLNAEEKEKIWLYFSIKTWFKKSNHIFHTIWELNEIYKRETYGQRLLQHGGPHFATSRYVESNLKSCCLESSLDDFKSIFLNANQDVVYEMLSIFVRLKLNMKLIENIDDTLDESSKKEYINTAYKWVDSFAVVFNDIFEQFSLNIILTRNGIIFRQDRKITEDIYVPVLSYLASKKWMPVNRDLSDAFRKYQDKTPQGYSSCITHAISSLQAFLQILVYEKTGKGDIKELLSSAQKKDLIPADTFSKKIFKDVESIIMQKRNESGDPHPKNEYANEKSAKLVLNLIMIFIQHCIINE